MLLPTSMKMKTITVFRFEKQLKLKEKSLFSRYEIVSAGHYNICKSVRRTL
jgi:hypothetical protein